MLVIMAISFPVATSIETGKSLADPYVWNRTRNFFLSLTFIKHTGAVVLSPAAEPVLCGNKRKPRTQYAGEFFYRQIPYTSAGTAHIYVPGHEKLHHYSGKAWTCTVFQPVAGIL